MLQWVWNGRLGGLLTHPSLYHVVLSDGLGEDLKSILHLVTRTSRIVNATDVVARSDWICILYLHVALCPRRLRQDVTGLVLGKLDY